MCSKKTKYKIFQEDSINLASKLPHSNLVYIDPPYNQHPYGSNYFMLNLIAEGKISSKISPVSGIPINWNRSDFNKKGKAIYAMDEIIKNIDSDYLLISYNNEGFISFDEMSNVLKKYGELSTKKIIYNTFRGSRNLNKRSLYTNEYLFFLKKRRG